MGQYIFGGAGGTAFSDATVYSDGISLPAADRPMSDGGYRCWVSALYAGFNGNGAGRTRTLSLDGVVAADLAVGSGGNAPGLVGVYASGFCNGGSTRFEVAGGGSIHFSHAGGGTNTHDTHGTAWSGTLYCGFDWWMGPTAPQGLTITPSTDGASAVVTVTVGPGDNGGLAVGGYYTQRADDAGFTLNVAQVTHGGTFTATGLMPGKTYYWRTCAYNQATQAAGLGGQWSSTMAVTQPSTGFGVIFNGSAWVQADALIFNGSAWVPAAAKIVNGSLTFVDV